MNLEERYNAAGGNTYVGRVRMMQAADAGARMGVNVTDGVPRDQGNTAPDEVQTEFKRNTAGDFRYGGGGKMPAATVNKSYPLSRWLPKGTQKGDDYFRNNRFTTLINGDIRNETGRIIHAYSSLVGKSFKEANILTQLAKGKLDGAPSGPAPV